MGANRVSDQLMPKYGMDGWRGRRKELALAAQRPAVVFRPWVVLPFAGLPGVAQCPWSAAGKQSMENAEQPAEGRPATGRVVPRLEQPASTAGSGLSIPKGRKIAPDGAHAGEQAERLERPQAGRRSKQAINTDEASGRKAKNKEPRQVYLTGFKSRR